jgi:hypothetical protein
MGHVRSTEHLAFETQLPCFQLASREWQISSCEMNEVAVLLLPSNRVLQVGCLENPQIDDGLAVTHQPFIEGLLCNLKPIRPRQTDRASTIHNYPILALEKGAR